MSTRSTPLTHNFSTLQTPLTIAACNGHLHCIKLLLMSKCDLYCMVRMEGQEMYAWDLAARRGHTDVAQYLQGCVGEKDIVVLAVGV